jgi:hypothetical protein
MSVCTSATVEEASKGLHSSVFAMSENKALVKILHYMNVLVRKNYSFKNFKKGVFDNKEVLASFL